MQKLTYTQLKSANDSDIDLLKAIHRLPSVSRFISIDENNYFNYVTTTENVYYYKVYSEEKLTAALHCEIYETVLHLSILVFPDFQRKRFGSAIIDDVINCRLPLKYTIVNVSIDKSNTSSIKLFEKMGFKSVKRDGELIDYTYTIHI